ncbi:hypothetical protein PRIO_5776 [Paenibacillus riograndensis SBR5]|uniref:Uncharacterized protein n=1 Tax=Paenibacillus riograndensis SBR5 TaxID=1073571 RepID=A0A0E3WJ48_9BACL|nr:hypothetical protein PRIO_5776 [Paenibacillus riograndensis SBR5]
MLIKVKPYGMDLPYRYGFCSGMRATLQNLMNLQFNFKR